MHCCTFKGTLSWVLWVAKCLCMLCRRWNLHPQTTQEYGFTIVLHQGGKNPPKKSQNPTCGPACASPDGTSLQTFDHTWDREPSNRIGTHKKRMEREEKPKRRTTPDPRSNPNLLTHPFYNNIRWPILATVGVFLIWSLLNRRCWSTRCVARPLETLMSALFRTIYSYGTQLRNTLYVTQRNPQKQAKHKK